MKVSRERREGVPSELVTSLFRGAAAYRFGLPIGGPFGVHMDRTGDADMFAVR